MCVICFTKGVSIDNDFIKKLWTANPDGAGFAFIDKTNKMFYKKGYLKLEDLISDLPKNRENMVLHFRIATQGLINSNNCHPFNIDNLKPNEGYASRLLFHNGMTPVSWKVKKKDEDRYSDTYLLCRDILSQVKNQKMYDAILSANSKYALFDESLSSEKWFLYGKWEDSDGMLFSNLNFKIKTQFLGGYMNRSARSYIWDEFDNYPYSGVDEEEKIIEGGESHRMFEDSVDVDFDEESYIYCEFCKVELHEDDIPFGVCADCTVQHGIFCDCKSRMVITADGGYFCSSGECN